MILKKIAAYCILSVCLVLGALCLYRASLSSNDMTILSGKVLGKKISYTNSIQSGRHYLLSFEIEGATAPIAINLGATADANDYFIYNSIDTGTVYKFYLDPTVPTSKRANAGITRIDYGEKMVYQGSKSFNLYTGVALSVLGLGGLVLVFKFPKEKR